MQKDKIEYKVLSEFIGLGEDQDLNSDNLAYVTHYFHNSQNGKSKFFSKHAEEHLINQVKKSFLAREGPLNYIFDFTTNSPFPPPGDPKFTFIDLFAGIGGFRIAFQNLGGKCVFSSEKDIPCKKTYFANLVNILLET